MEINRNTIAKDHQKTTSSEVETVAMRQQGLRAAFVDLLPLARAFEGVVNQPAKQSEYPKSRNNQNISEVHMELELFVRSFEDEKNYDSKNTCQNIEDKKPLLKLLSYHECSPSCEKYIAIYKKTRVPNIPAAEVINFSDKETADINIWFAAAPRNNPLATSLQKSARVADWVFDKFDMLQDYHNQAPTSCQ